jgi:dolichyl-diphosphooligosaccharide--protein glycosyltransferase/undecaprenyl-diphosphooligosaccharide--protein glycosyltransferase
MFKGQKYDKYIYYILGVSVVAFFVSGGFNPILGKLQAYVFTTSVSSADEGLKLHFFSVMQTVREAGHIPFETFANRISGHSVTFLLSLVGYVWLSYKHRVMLFALPMVGLGFLAYVGGLRFTIYAVPVMAMGIAFLITELTRYITDKKSVTYLSYAVLTLSILFPNYRHIDSYRVPTVFNADEVKVLEELKSKANREDYVISWWDYGYPIRYYSDMKTLTDGGKHGGSVNFPVSFILTHPQNEAAKLARLDVEYTEKTFKFIEEQKEEIKDKNLTIFSNIEQMTKDYGFDDTNDFLLSLQTDIKLPKKTRDIYLYLPFRMLEIYPTVLKFSNLDLMDGNTKADPFYFVSRRFKETKESINFGNGIVLNKKDQTLSIGKQKVPLRRVVQTYYDKNMKLQKNVQLVNFGAPLSLIYISAFKTFLVVDEATYHSLYIQLMVLEEYDKNLFEQVIINPHAKVYKLK